MDIIHIEKNTWIDYLQKLYEEEQHTLRELETLEITANKETIISALEIEDIQKKLKNQKTAGKDK